MAITKGLVEMMNGNIDVESEKGVGTTFTVTVILNQSTVNHESDKVKQDTTENNSSATKVDLAGKRILLAEDMEINAEIMTEILKMHEMEIEHAANGKIVVEMFEKSAVGYYAAILMDMQMPVMSGLEATKTIRKLNRADAKTIPIVALTANAFDEDVQRSLQAGMNSHLSKPIDPKEIYSTLEKLINPL